MTWCEAAIKMNQPVGQEMWMKHLTVWGYLFVIIAFLLSTLIGRGGLTISGWWEGVILGPYSEHPHALIIWWVRLPQAFTALLAGSALALSGAALQTLLRNPLADPYLLGVSSGGGLGAALALSLGWVNLWGLWTLPSLSFLGALIACAWIYRFAHGPRGVQTGDLILAGVALNLFLAAVLTLVLTLSGQKLGGIWRWLLGHVEGLNWGEVSWLFIGVMLGISLILRSGKELSLMEAGEEVAWSLGVEVRSIKRVTLIASALSVGAVVAFCGIIGFVGLMIPHFLRPHLSGAYESIFLLSAIYGGASLCICDALSRLSPIPLPVGVITSTLGGALFLFMLSREMRQDMSR